MVVEEEEEEEEMNAQRGHCQLAMVPISAFVGAASEAL